MKQFSQFLKKFQINFKIEDLPRIFNTPSAKTSASFIFILKNILIAAGDRRDSIFAKHFEIHKEVYSQFLY